MTNEEWQPHHELRSWMRERLLGTVLPSASCFGKLSYSQAKEAIDCQLAHPRTKELVAQCYARRLMGYYRYEQKDKDGLSYGDKVQRGVGLNYHERMALKLKEYERTGNLELVMDIRNYCDLEYLNRSHPLAHFESKERHDNDDPYSY